MHSYKLFRFLCQFRGKVPMQIPLPFCSALYSLLPLQELMSFYYVLIGSEDDYALLLRIPIAIQALVTPICGLHGKCISPTVSHPNSTLIGSIVYFVSVLKLKTNSFLFCNIPWDFSKLVALFLQSSAFAFVLMNF